MFIIQATLTFTDIQMKFMDDLKWAWKYNKLEPERAKFIEGNLFNPLSKIRTTSGKLKKYDFIWFYPPQRREIQQIYGDKPEDEKELPEEANMINGGKFGNEYLEFEKEVLGQRTMNI